MRFWCTSHKHMVTMANCDHYKKVTPINSCLRWTCFEHEDDYERNNQQKESGWLVAPSSTYLNCWSGITDRLMDRMEEIIDDITPSLMTTTTTFDNSSTLGWPMRDEQLVMDEMLSAWIETAQESALHLAERPWMTHPENLYFEWKPRFWSFGFNSRKRKRVWYG